jgi:hypothetical protein
MAHTKNKNKRKPNKNSQKRKVSSSSSTNYPFINPIITTSDNHIVDGQHRYEVCKEYKLEFKYERMSFSSEQMNEEIFFNELRAIQNGQRIRLEKWFTDKKINFKEQLIMCSSIDRMQKFFEFENEFESDIEYWTQLAKCYSVSDNNFKHINEVRQAFSSKRLNREYLMSPKERDILNSLPDIVTIFRGMSEEEDKSGSLGISWTLNKSVAEKFANEFIHNYDTNENKHLVKELQVPKSSIIAYFGERQEEEIIYLT